jgi:RNA polymerase sigma-70 factor (ECF subfamily)
MDDPTASKLAVDLDGTFPRLVELHQHRLYSIALRVLGNPHDAEEVAQDAFVRAYRALATYEPQRIRALELRPWLATIVVNLCRNRLRRRRPVTVTIDPGEPGAPDPPAPDPRGDPHAAAVRRETRRRWAAILAQLPERYRTPVVLRHVDGLSYEEMARVLGRPQGTIKAQVHRGLAQLRAAAQHAAALDLEEMSA